jgi:hypothetical protein
MFAIRGQRRKRSGKFFQFETKCNVCSKESGQNMRPSAGEAILQAEGMTCLSMRGRM